MLGSLVIILVECYPVSMLSENSRVDQLIDKESRWWNSSLIDSIFYPLKLRKLCPYLYVPHHRKMFCFGHILQMVCIQLSQVIICSVNQVAEMQLHLLTLLIKKFQVTPVEKFRTKLNLFFGELLLIPFLPCRIY